MCMLILSSFIIIHFVSHYTSCCIKSVEWVCAHHVCLYHVSCALPCVFTQFQHHSQSKECQQHRPRGLACCDRCADDIPVHAAVFYCGTCHAFLCDERAGAHRCKPKTADHVLVSLLVCIRCFIFFSRLPALLLTLISVIVCYFLYLD